jgi:hypothetical protein
MARMHQPAQPTCGDERAVCPRRITVIGDIIAIGPPQTGDDRGERLVRAVFCVLAAAILASGCGSDDKPVPAKSEASSEQILKKDCADPKWREQNLGLWYSVCRQPLRW